MDRIERTVTLPPRAAPLSEYARYYADGEGGAVVAVYLALPPLNAGLGCTVEQIGGAGRPCTADEVRAIRTRAQQDPARQLRAGERRWYPQRQRLPYIFDGGCNQVTITYAIAQDRFEQVACNGYA